MNVCVATANRGRRKTGINGRWIWGRNLRKRALNEGRGRCTQFSTLLMTRQLFLDSSTRLESSRLIGGCVSCLTTSLLNSYAYFGFGWELAIVRSARWVGVILLAYLSHCIIMRIYHTQEVSIDENVFSILLENE